MSGKLLKRLYSSIPYRLTTDGTAWTSLTLEAALFLVALAATSLAVVAECLPVTRAPEILALITLLRDEPTSINAYTAHTWVISNASNSNNM